MAVQRFLGKKTNRIILILAVAIVLLAATTCRGFIRGPFSGRVIDAETKAPIEGAVVVVVWNKSVYGSPGGPITYFVGARETLTDKNGDFYIAAHGPVFLTPVEKIRDQDVHILIFKPGYAAFPGGIDEKSPYMVGRNIQIKLFTKDRKSIKADEEFFYEETPFLEDREAFKALLKADVAVVELPKLKTREERLRNIPGGPTDVGADKLPLFYKAINEEGKRFGLGEVR